MKPVPLLPRSVLGVGLGILDEFFDGCRIPSDMPGALLTEAFIAMTEAMDAFLAEDGMYEIRVGEYPMDRRIETFWRIDDVRFKPPEFVERPPLNLGDAARSIWEHHYG